MERMTLREFFLLTPFARWSDAGLLLLRVLIGAFLIYGVWDNIASEERMQEFVAFLTKFGFPAPDFMARLSVWAQFVVGLAFISGLLTRWAGVICAINFVVAIAMVDRFAGIRGAFPSACLVAIGVYLALRGAGMFSVDARIERRASASD